MQYRNYKQDGRDSSLLGFGAMRMPTVNGIDSQIDEKEAIKMIRHAIDNGVRYVDTAYVYHGGNSEVIVGKALKDGYREKVILADKLPIWELKPDSSTPMPQQLRNIFNTQLKRLDLDFIDNYLVHNIDDSSWEKVKKFGLIDFFKELKANGEIGHIGFSFHGSSPEFFKEVIDGFDGWEFCQIQLNYMDADYQAGLKGLEYAGSKGIPVVVMEPLKGGKLVQKLPPSVQKYWGELDVIRTPAAWAFNWIASRPEVLTILSGMSTMEQLQENIEIFSDENVGKLTENEFDIISKAAEKYNSLIPYGCTKCQYCMPCAAGINIPMVIEFRNQWTMYEGATTVRNEFYMNSEVMPSACVHCLKCEGHCPQHLKVSEIMDESAKIFE